MEYKEKVKITYSKKSEGDFYKFVNELVKALFDSEMYTDIFIRSEEKIIEFYSNKRFKVYLKTFSENRKDIILIDSEEPEVDFRVMLSETGTVFKIRTRIGCSRKEIKCDFKKDLVPNGRPRIKVDEEKFKEVYKGVEEGSYTSVEAMRMLKLSKSTYYRRLKEIMKKENKDV